MEPPIPESFALVPIAVVMISYNEAHNMRAVLDNISGWAQQIFLVDSFSSDETVDIALSYGVRVVQREFRGFGDQWNFALRELPIAAPWTMKLDPDERLTDEAKRSIEELIDNDEADAFTVQRRLWFMGEPLPVIQLILRGWRTGTCRFSDVLVNEHPLVDGRIANVSGRLEHHDSPDLHHWVEKQNRYTTAEAVMRYRQLPMAAHPDLFGSRLERRMWMKRLFFQIPFRYQLYFLANLVSVQFWRSGRNGVAWARLRVWVRRLIEDKVREMAIRGEAISLPPRKLGKPHPRALHCE